MNYKIWSSLLSAGALTLMIVGISFFVGTRSDRALNLTVIVVGFCVGWLLGIMMSPYSASEKTRFAQYASAFGAFVSGYLVSKADKFLEAILDPQFVLDSVHGFRVLAFVAALVLAAIITFVFREYAQ
jgi:hypothetical protein